MIDRRFWRGRRVFLTGHTGFKGTWLALWLRSLGAEVTGYALDPPTDPSLSELCRLGRLVGSVTADVRDLPRLAAEIRRARPHVVFHLAAQSLVRESYRLPVDTYAVNVLGTVNLLEACRGSDGLRAVVVVSSDKCYENREWFWAYREDDALGGHDPYSSSKACAELATAAYVRSFFPPAEHRRHGVAVATARAGNVIGGGDFAADRLVPDCVRALLAGEEIVLRNPRSVRPWQHVLVPLSGYLALAQRLFAHGPRFAGAWNFGPAAGDARNVESVVRLICAGWGGRAGYRVDRRRHPHEAGVLTLSWEKARTLLGWQPCWGLEEAVEKILEWTRAYRAGRPVRTVVLRQIREYTALLGG